MLFYLVRFALVCLILSLRTAYNMQHCKSWQGSALLHGWRACNAPGQDAVGQLIDV